VEERELWSVRICSGSEGRRAEMTSFKMRLVAGAETTRARHAGHHFFRPGRPERWDRTQPEQKEWPQGSKQATIKSVRRLTMCQ
jgi:hypothetical protein